MDKTLERILTLIPQNENGRFVHGAAAEFADKIGIAHNLPTEWKSGRNKSYMTKLYEISNAYDVSVEWLLGASDVKEKPTTGNGGGQYEKRRRAQNLIEAMNEETLDALLKLEGRRDRFTQQFREISD